MIRRLHWTFRLKLLGLSALAAVAVSLLIGVETLSNRAIDQALARIEERYVPLLAFRPLLEADYEQLVRAFQDSVAAKEVELQEPRQRYAALLSRLERVPAVVDQGGVQRLRRELEGYYAAALDVSRRLIAGEPGETVIAAIRTMQERQREVRRRIDEVAGFDRARLASAFEAVRGARARGTRARLLIQVAMLAVVFLISLRLAAGILRAVRELSAGFERFSRGDFSQPMRVMSDDELGHAAQEANRMADSLAALSEQQRRTQEELERANKDLEAFSYSVAHDLRAPLRSIDGFSLALVEDFGDKLEPEARGYLERVRSAAQRMALLIDDLLLLSRITRAELHRETLDLSALARAVAAELQAHEPARQVTFRIAEGLEVRADPQLMRVVFENLLGNAWKFTSKKEHAVIEVGQGDGGGRGDGDRCFFVRDDGAGFDMAHADNLFRPFERLHSAAQFPGTGIGLASVHRIVTRHGGRVWAVGAPNAGATFFFSLGK